MRVKRLSKRDKLKNKLKLLAALFICIITAGCSTGISVENLLTPPKLTAEQSEIYQALINSIGSNVKLKYPRGGDYRSAFVLHNIDDEPDEEALVFYENSSVQSGESALRLKLLDKQDGTWQVMYDLACAGSDIDGISFANLGTGSTVDIIVCCSMLNQTEKSVSVLNYHDGVPVELYSSSYSCLEVIDLNSDELNELVIVTADKANQTSTAAMYTNTENGFEKLSDVKLSGTSDYISVTKGLLNENMMALFLDYARGAGQYGTDVVYCYGNRLTSPESVSSQSDNSPIISRFTNDYMAEIRCFDIDRDGYIEIPSMTPLPGYETLTRPEQLCAVQWYTIEYNNFKMKHYSYYSSKYDFALLFPNRWYGVVTAVVNSQDNEIIFIAYNNYTGLEVSEATEIMRIRTIARADAAGISAALQLGYDNFAENDDSVYFIAQTADYHAGRLALTDSELKNSFKVIS